MRVTIVLDDSLLSKLKAIQSEEILISPTNVSFSKVVNDAIRKGLKFK